MRKRTSGLLCAAAALLAGCASIPKGDRAEDYLPFSVPWTGTFTSSGKEPRPLIVKHAAPKGKVWSIDVSKFYFAGQVAFLLWQTGHKDFQPE